MLDIWTLAVAHVIGLGLVLLMMWYALNHWEGPDE